MRLFKYILAFICAVLCLNIPAFLPVYAAEAERYTFTPAEMIALLKSNELIIERPMYVNGALDVVATTNPTIVEDQYYIDQYGDNWVFVRFGFDEQAYNDLGAQFSGKMRFKLNNLLLGDLELLEYGVAVLTTDDAIRTAWPDELNVSAQWINPYTGQATLTGYSKFIGDIDDSFNPPADAIRYYETFTRASDGYESLFSPIRNSMSGGSSSVLDFVQTIHYKTNTFKVLYNLTNAYSMIAIKCFECVGTTNAIIGIQNQLSDISGTLGSLVTTSPEDSDYIQSQSQHFSSVSGVVSQYVDLESQLTFTTLTEFPDMLYEYDTDSLSWFSSFFRFYEKIPFAFTLSTIALWLALISYILYGKKV